MSAGGIVALTVSVTLAVGCESILGIDDQSVMEASPMPTGGASGASGGATGGVSSEPGSGGLLPSTGGVPPGGSGGALPPPEDAGPACDGPCVAAVVCRPGHYEGTFLGKFIVDSVDPDSSFGRLEGPRVQNVRQDNVVLSRL